MDRSWMLNAEALRASKECIKIVKRELGVRLTLAHPDFLLLIKEYTELVDSQELKFAYERLLALADNASVAKVLQSSGKGLATLTTEHVAGPEPNESQIGDTATESLADDGEQETITYRGKSYPKWRNSKRFRGCYL